MSAFDESFYVSDLDGTLLAPDGLLSPFARMQLEGLLGRGLQFTVASARSVLSIRGTLRGLELPFPVVCFNGGFVSDLSTGEHIEVFELGDAARGAWELAREHGLEPLVSTTDGVSEDRVWIAQRRNAGVQMYVDDRLAARDPRVRFVGEPGGHIDERVTCLTVIDRRDRLEPYEAALRARWGERLRPHLFDDLYTSGWAWITVHAGEATKARAVRSVMEREGHGARRLVAFGDQANDLPLLREADHAVAVENAIPELRDAADEVIGHHAEDAVVRWLLDEERR